MKSLIKINNHDIQVKSHKEQRVITFKDIDIVHERAEGTASRNFNQNKEHFIECEDYFTLKGDELQNFATTNFVVTNISKVRELTLITESGYLMLVKSLTDELAWKVQRELVNNYFKAKQRILNPMDTLRLQYKVLEEHEGKLTELDSKVDNLANNMPLFNIECKEIQALVRKTGIRILGGYHSKAYTNNSLRGKVYSDIQHELRREFGVCRYEAIKRCQINKAQEIISNYKAPTVLKEQIIVLNSQLNMEA